MRQRALSLAVAVIVGVALVSASGAATTNTQKVTKIDVSTRAAVVHYLRSIHVNAKHAVIQRGLRNYAGAHCPGKGWTCAGTRHTVVQIAKRGGQNRFACGTAKCAVVQFGGASRGLRAASRGSKPKPPPPPNYALCVKTTGVTQSCVINQPNASGMNKAVVWMVTPKQTGLTQSSNYSASITQGPTSAGTSSNTNLACVRQFVWLDGSTTKTNTASTTVTNDNHELIKINQNSLTGTNTVQGAVLNPTTGVYNCNTDPTAPLTQDEQLTSVVNSKGSITQNQNTLPSTRNCLPPDVSGFGCANVVTDVEQNQDKNGFSGFMGHASGVNSAFFDQSTTQVAIGNTSKGTVNQTQGADVPDPPYSGLVGTINQDSSAQSTAVVNQNETQCEDAVSVSPAIPAPTDSTPAVCPVASDQGVPGNVNLTQTQWGPEGVLTPSTGSAGPVHYYHKGYGKSEQTGTVSGSGVVDNFTLIQHSHQSADQTGGQHNTMQGDCASSGNGSDTGGTCDASQTVTLNGQDPTRDGYKAGSIDKLIIHCTSGDSCTATPPPDPTLTATPPVDLNGDTTATTASFEFTDPATDAKFICKLDGTVQPTPNCGSPSVINNLADGAQAYGPLGLGAQTFQVAAVDSAGNKSHFIPLSPDPFSWTIVPPCTIGAGTSPLGYSSMPSDVVNCGPSSLGFEATSTNEFGDEVGLDTAGGTSLQSLTVDLQSYGCGESGQWNTGATDPCMTTSGETFTVPGGIRATIYSVNQDGSVGSVLATSTIHPDIPYRPSADPSNCPDSGGNGDNDTGSKWFDPVANACRYSLSYPVTFTNWSSTPTFTSGQEVIWTVQYDTTNAGYNPLGTQACNALDQGCGYDSLNVGTKTYTNAATNFSTAPYAGTDVDEDVAFRSYDDPGYSGNHVSLAAETDWSGFRPLGKIVLAPPPSP